MFFSFFESNLNFFIFSIELTKVGATFSPPAVMSKSLIRPKKGSKGFKQSFRMFQNDNSRYLTFSHSKFY